MGRRCFDATGVTNNYERSYSRTISQVIGRTGRGAGMDRDTREMIEGFVGMASIMAMLFLIAGVM